MEMIQGQLMYVAASFVEGVFLMFLYDFIRAFRMKVKHGSSGYWQLSLYSP